MALFFHRLPFWRSPTRLQTKHIELKLISQSNQICNYCTKRMHRFQTVDNFAKVLQKISSRTISFTIALFQNRFSHSETRENVVFLSLTSCLAKFWHVSRNAHLQSLANLRYFSFGNHLGMNGHRFISITIRAAFASRK